MANCKTKIEKEEEDQLAVKIKDIEQKIENIKLSNAQKNKQILAPELKKIISKLED